jgi:hypothetical protein
MRVLNKLRNYSYCVTFATAKPEIIKIADVVEKLPADSSSPAVIKITDYQILGLFNQSAGALCKPLWQLARVDASEKLYL